MKRMAKFTKSLIMRASQLAERCNKHWDNSVPGITRREISLILDQIDRLKIIFDKQMLQLLRTECDINTDIKQLSRQMPHYPDCQDPEMVKLKKRISTIEDERRMLLSKLEDRRRPLETKLLDLVNRVELIDI